MAQPLQGCLRQSLEQFLSALRSLRAAAPPCFSPPILFSELLKIAQDVKTGAWAVIASSARCPAAGTSAMHASCLCLTRVDGCRWVRALGGYLQNWHAWHNAESTQVHLQTCQSLKTSSCADTHAERHIATSSVLADFEMCFRSNSWWSEAVLLII